MNKIEKMIHDMCPDGVEYKKLKDVVVFNPKSKIGIQKAKQLNGNKYIFFTSGIKTLMLDTYIVDGENIFLNNGGSADFKYYNGKANYSDHVMSLKANENYLLNKYLFYFLLNSSNYIESTYFKGSGLKNISKKDFKEFKIPIPPLEIQNEIVKVLDKFTELTTELTTELKLRKKQYEYYRNKLLTFKESEGGGSDSED